MPWGATLIEGTTSDAPFARRCDYDATGNLIYTGAATPGTLTSAAKWRIQKLTYSGTGNLLSIIWPNGEAEFANVWDNRTSLTYS